MKAHFASLDLFATFGASFLELDKSGKLEADVPSVFIASGSWACSGRGGERTALAGTSGGPRGAERVACRAGSEAPWLTSIERRVAAFIRGPNGSQLAPEMCRGINLTSFGLVVGSR